MNTISPSMRKWITTIIVMIFVYQAYVALGISLFRIADFTSLDINTLRMIYNDLNIIVYSMTIVGWLMCGFEVRKSDLSPLSKWSSGLLIGYGFVSLLWQFTALINHHVAINLIPRPLFMCLNISVSVLLCSALILLALYYGKRNLLGLGISYTVLYGISVILYPFVFPIDGSMSTALHVTYSLLSAASLLLLIIYLFKWRKV